MCGDIFHSHYKAAQLKGISFKVEIQNIPPGLLVTSEGSLFLLGLLKTQLPLLCLSSQIRLALTF